MPAIRGGSRGAIRAIDPPKTYESNSIHHDLVQFGKQHIKNNSEQVFRDIRIVLLFAIGHSVVHCFVTAVL